MVKKTKALGMDAIALTDHGNMFGAMEFYTAAKKEGIKPILGMEAYIVGQGSRHTRKRPEKGQRENKTYHLVLLCENEQGYRNLAKLSSLAYLEGYYYKPRLDKEILREYSEGLIGLTACLGGEITNLHLNDRHDEAKEVLAEYLDIFGEKNFFLEIQRHGMAEDKAYDCNLKLAREMGVGFVATNDVHYTEKHHWESHDILICMQGGKSRNDANRHRYEPEEFYLRSPQEMNSIFADLPEACQATIDIANRCNVEIKFNDYKMPVFPIPEAEGDIDDDEYLRRKAERGLKMRYAEVTEALMARLNFELDVIKKMGFASYFLITLDFIEAAREKGIPVGLGRGSAAGSLVAYSTWITSVDPIKYNLLFERFLNPERVSMPDVDIDFCMRRREEVIQYVRDKYGEKNVCQIITYGTLAPKNAIKDVARVLEIPFDKSNQITKNIPVEGGKPWSVKRSFTEIPELMELLESDDPVYKELARHAEVLEGAAKSVGIHAAGVIIAPEEVSNLIPVAKNNDDIVMTQYDMKYSEMIGLLKMDFLGLRTLTVIDDAVKMIRKFDPEKYGDFDIEAIPMDDEATYDLYGNGKTVGVFQFESKGMREYLRKLKPNRVEDLIAMNALYRPGPMQFIDDFIDRKYGRKVVEYLDPRLEPILNETYGIIVYQEQVMQIVSNLGGFSLGEADIVRRAMGKKQHDVMAKYKEKFVTQAKNLNQISEAVSAEIYDMIVKFASYGFNKSHSAAYSILSYQTAYLKTHFPAQFMASIMSSEITSPDRIVVYMEECKALGIKVLPPDVNVSFPDFSAPDKHTVAFGMHAIKNVGLSAIETIVNAREVGKKKFKTIFGLIESSDSRQVNRKVLEALIQAGALDSLEGNRAQKFNGIDMAIEFASKLNSAKTDENQFNLFGEAQKIKVTYPQLPEVADWSSTEKLRREKDLLGFFVSGHPLEKYKHDLSLLGQLTFDENQREAVEIKTQLAGLVIGIKNTMTKKGDKMAFVSVENFDYSFEAVIFPRTWQTYEKTLVNGAMLIFSGKVNYTDRTNVKILADDIYPLDEAVNIFVNAVEISIDLTAIDVSKVAELNLVLGREFGEAPVYFKVKSDEETEPIRMLSNKYKINTKKETLSELKSLMGDEAIRIS
jgi:DNA polymerase-3 subunit alpha